MIEPSDTSKAALARARQLIAVAQDVADRHGILDTDLLSKRHVSDKMRKLRNEFCWLATVNTDASAQEIANAIGYTVASSVTYAVRQHAILIGESVRTFQAARAGISKQRVVDWPRLADLITLRVRDERGGQSALAKRCDVHRRVIAWLTQGKPVNADDLLSVLAALEIPVWAIVREPYRARLHRARP